MGERPEDSNKNWEYFTSFPGADYRLNQAAVGMPRLVEATGLDGRSLGACRPFPGMADDTVHGVPQPEANVTTVEAITGITAAWYVAIQKGISRYTLKGLAYLADSQSGTGINRSLYFAFRDSDPTPEHGAGGAYNYDVVELEDFDSWDDFKLSSVPYEYDVTSMGRYIYFVASADTTSNVSSFDGKAPPYNKAYFWDWKINEWDNFADGFDNRFMSLMPERLLATQLNAGGFGSILETGANADVDNNPVVDLSDDTPDLSDVSDQSIHTLILYGRSDGVNGSDRFTITGVNDGADTVTVTPTPGTPEDPVVWAIRGSATNDGVDAFWMAPSTQSGEPIDPPGPRTYMCELVSRKHNLRSWPRVYSKWEDRTLRGTRQYEIFKAEPPQQTFGGAVNQVQGYYADGTMGSSSLKHWGVPHMDGFRLWRSPFSTLRSSEDFEETPGGNDEDALSHYEVLQTLYMVEDYWAKGTYQGVGAAVFYQLDSWLGVYDGIENKIPFYTDEGLIQLTPYDPFLDAFGPAPRLKRLQAYDGLLVGITDVEQPSLLTDNWEESDQRPEELAWSTLLAQEPENFPPENRYPPDDAGEKFLALEPAGDHLFGVSAKGVYRVVRSGDQIALTRMAFRLGGVSRWGQTGVDNVLFIVTKAGVKSIDGNSGAVQSISAMDRIVMDDSEWAQSLGSVILEYDATLGALIFLNTEKDEAFILWESTGAVTRMADCPWTFMVGGPNVLTNGPQRAYFVMSDGVTHCIDGAREMGKRSMCGTESDETVNGTCTTGSDADTIKDSTATFPVNCVGHRIYMLSGDYDGESGLIDTRDSATELTLDASDKLSGAPAVGDRFSVAPVVTEIVLSQLGGIQQPISPFTRKIVGSMSCAFSDLGGETGSDDVNPYVRMGLWRNKQRLLEVETAINILPDKCVARVVIGDTRIYPSIRVLSGNVDFELQAVLLKGTITGTEAQSRQG